MSHTKSQQLPTRRHNLCVIAGLDPAIHDAPPQAQSVRLCPLRLIMDARVKPAHDVARFADTSEHEVRAVPTQRLLAGTNGNACGLVSSSR
jgi:hypothetical protein